MAGALTELLERWAQANDKPIVLLLDATNLERNLFLASQVIDLGLPTVAALNMMDLAHRDHIKIDVPALARELGCEVIPVSARSGSGIEDLRKAMASLVGVVNAPKPAPLHSCSTCGGCPFQARYDWAEGIGSRVIGSPRMTHGRKTEAVDRFLTHPVVGVLAFTMVMFAVFAMIYWIAQYPMDSIDGLFAFAGGNVGSWMDALAAAIPEGALQTIVANDVKSLLVDGIIGGVGGVLIFLPQICILFFFLSLLEDTGYLARAAFVMDKLMRSVGLPGKAFVPMLSAHACAVPAIMAARGIEDHRDRMVTIMILPLMTCAARIPVYAMVVALIFPQQPLTGSLLFTGAYVLGIVAALAMGFVFKKTLLKGETRPLVLELPSYKMPSLRSAFLVMLDRALVFVKQAGTVILIASVILWALANYPKSDPPVTAVAISMQAQTLEMAGQTDEAQALHAQADKLAAQHTLANSVAGRLGHLIEPVIAPIGYDWQIGIGILSSFAAREVFVSTLAIVYGVGADAVDEDPQGLYATLQSAQRADGTPVFTMATGVSILVFYVLAMQCISTLAIVKRETGSWKWPAFQFAYMTVLAYGAALVAYQGLHLAGIA
ncbi:MAG: ferrous iron transporter B [Phycisphaerales bacterium]|nr:ferrous iron transporter B [Phycisphaerales bacterium]